MDLSPIIDNMFSNYPDINNFIPIILGGISIYILFLIMSIIDLDNLEEMENAENEDND